MERKSSALLAPKLIVFEKSKIKPLVVQYGEDSLDVTKSQYIKPDRLSDLAANMGSTYRPALVEAARAHTDTKAVRRARKAVKKWAASRGEQQHHRTSPFLHFSASHATLPIRYFSLAGDFISSC